MSGHGLSQELVHLGAVLAPKDGQHLFGRVIWNGAVLFDPAKKKDILLNLGEFVPRFQPVVFFFLYFLTEFS